MDYITLNNGVKMPIMGLGTYLLSPDEAENASNEWLEPVNDEEYNKLSHGNF